MTKFLFAGTRTWDFNQRTDGKPKDDAGIRIYQYTKCDDDIKLAATNSNYLNLINASFFAFSNDRRRLFVVQESDEDQNDIAGVVTFDVTILSSSVVALKEIERRTTHGAGACHATVIDDILLISNYHTGSVTSFKICDQGLTPSMTLNFTHHTSTVPDRQRSAHCHSTHYDTYSKLILICDLGADRAYIRSLDSDANLVKHDNQQYVEFEPGSGPRHAASNGGEYIYISLELSSQVAVLRYDNVRRQFDIIQTISTLLAIDHLNADTLDFQAVSHLAISNGCPFLYVANRGRTNSIALFKIIAGGELRFEKNFSCHGMVPRHFTFDGNSVLLCANEQSDTIQIFDIEPNGHLVARHSIACHRPQCLQVIEL